ADRNNLVLGGTLEAQAGQSASPLSLLHGSADLHRAFTLHPLLSRTAELDRAGHRSGLLSDGHRLGATLVRRNGHVASLHWAVAHCGDGDRTGPNYLAP